MAKAEQVERQERRAVPRGPVERVFGRSFNVVCFAWDGTAVADRQTDAAPLRSRVERLAALGVDVAIVSTANVATIDAQLRARPAAEGHLLLLLSRGSEVYVVGPTGPRLLERRQMSREETERLDAAALAIRTHLEERGLTVAVHERLNRRKIDLVPEWRHPPKGDFSLLVKRTERRLGEVAIGDLGAVMALADHWARGAGMTRPLVTTDGKHLDIGTTDKADSLRWLLDWIVRDRGHEPGQVLVVGDEFGKIGGHEGSDERGLIPELRAATFVSVGAEPNGVPPRVTHLGGGPQRLLDILDEQIELRVSEARTSFPVPNADPGWLFPVEGFDPFREREVETWLTVANGETGTRGSLEEGSAASTPATFVAGVYGDGTGDPKIRQPVPAPDWLCLRLLVDGMHLNLANGEVLEHRRVLDMSQGLVFRFWRQRDRVGRTVRVRTVRFASVADRSLLALRAEATPEDFCGRLIWEGCVGVSHAGGPTLESSFESRDGSGFVARTRGRHGGGHVLAISTQPAEGSPVARTVEQWRDVIGGTIECDEPATVDRLAAVSSSMSRVPAAASALSALAAAERTGFDELVRRHVEEWRRIWVDAEIGLEGDAQAQLALRFAVFHMLSTAQPAKDAVSIGARGLSGMSYFMHVFWDTEIFVVPFFIYSWPEAARTMLVYRYRNLDGARHKAHTMGHKGALFPWESADSGEETTPAFGRGPQGEKIPILSGLMEHHISADVAWAVWEYWKCTGDDDFMRDMGVEIVAETARFWASRASRDRQGRYHIPLVVGPDEYHEGVDDNAYTNVLARWNIRRAHEALTWLNETHADAARRLQEKIGLTWVELLRWQKVAAGLVDGYEPKSKLFEQFAGFYEMDDVDPAALAQKPLAADLLLGREVTLRSKVVKQADVVMLCYLLPDEIDDDTARANLQYYEPLTCHGSSLSPGIHAALAARLGDLDQAVESFRLAADIDLSDNMGNAARGLHLATMGGLWQAAVMGFGGVRRVGEALRVDPHLPEQWPRLTFALQFRGARLRLEITAQELALTVDEAPVTLVLGRRRRRLAPGAYRFVRRPRKVWEEAP
jgi:trehalose/maltose hydrolase-like predicted phosphorylase